MERKGGEEAKKGCSQCATYFPGRTDQCMDCGGICIKKGCDGKRGAECYESQPFLDCHKVFI